MKHLALLLTMAAFLFLTSCADKPSRPDSILTQAQISAADAAASVSANAGVQSAPSGGTELPHYYCANSCEGSGGGSPGTCPTCGNTYTHNEAFHNRAPTPAPIGNVSSPGQTITPVTAGSNNTTPITPTQVTPTQTPPSPSPAQNANGVYHYICSAGCAGGAGGAGNCGSCGGALTHNAEYHN